jgi:Ca2+-binding EF-hand superfamily protein
MLGTWQTDFDDIIDGMLTFEEFAAGFDMFDTNGNGVINRDEMNAALA